MFFFEILETHFITKYLQISLRASRLVLGLFWKPGHHLSMWVLDINMRGPGNKKPRPKELASKELASKELGVLGYSDRVGLVSSRLFRSIGSGRSDEWKSRRNVPTGGRTLHLHIFPDGWGIDDRASMIGHR